MNKKLREVNCIDSNLNRYPKLIAHMICESLGYLSPKAAANLLVAYKHGVGFYCEWIMACWPESMSVPERTKDVIVRSIRNRHHHKGYMNDYRLARKIVAASIAGHDPIFGSWF